MPFSSLTASRWFFDHILPKHQEIHPTSGKCMKRLLSSIHNGFPFQVKRGIEHHRHSCSLSKGLDQPVVFRAQLFLNRLEPPRAIHVSDGGDYVPFVFSHVDYIEHETGRIVPGRFRQHEVFLRPLRQNRRSKGAERLAELDLDVDEILHVSPPRISQDTPMPQRSRPPLKPSLKPPDDLPCLQPIHNPLYQLLFILASLIVNALLFQELFDLPSTMLLS